MCLIREVNDTDLVVEMLDILGFKPEDTVVVQGTGKAVLELVSDALKDTGVEVAFLDFGDERQDSLTIDFLLPGNCFRDTRNL